MAQYTFTGTEEEIENIKGLIAMGRQAANLKESMEKKRYLTAIWLIREFFGWGLRDGRDFVAALKAEGGRMPALDAKYKDCPLTTRD